MVLDLALSLLRTLRAAMDSDDRLERLVVSWQRSPASTCFLVRFLVDTFAAAQLHLQVRLQRLFAIFNLPNRHTFTRVTMKIEG
jgi:hypothetical protein